MTDAEAEVALGHLFNELDRSGHTELLLLAIRNKHMAGLALLTAALEREPAVTPADVAMFAFKQGELNGIKRIERMFASLADAARATREPQG